jgi:hypothetical protein
MERAYYFSANTVTANTLKFLIKEIISQLQEIGFIVCCTVCDQPTTNCSEKGSLQSLFCFFVNKRQIVTIFDVPHLLKNTRNALC